MPELTIIVPAYNVGAYLEQCVASILAQTYTNFTLLLLDDGSTDETASLCDAWAAKDARVQVVHTENRGVCETVFAGIAMAKTEYIGFVDGDDWVVPAMYEDLMAAVKLHNADMAQCGVLINGTHIQDDLTCKQEYMLRTPKTDVFVPYYEKDAGLYPVINARWNKVYRRSVLAQAVQGIDRSLSMGEDLVMNLAFLPLCGKAVLLAGHENYCYRVVSGASHRYTVKKRLALAKMYDEVRRIATQYGCPLQAVAADEQRMTASLMLNVLFSALPVRARVQELQILDAQLTDAACLARLAEAQPLYGKAIIRLLQQKHFGTAAALTRLFTKITGVQK